MPEIEEENEANDSPINKKVSKEAKIELQEDHIKDC
jgi:hypothetical protein